MITDNATNNNTLAITLQTMMRGSFNAEQHHLPCLGHVINLVVQAGFRFTRNSDDDNTSETTASVGLAVCKLRKLVKMMTASSHRIAEFERESANMGFSQKSLILDVTTRWNSTGAMIKRAIEYQSVNHEN